MFSKKEKMVSDLNGILSLKKSGLRIEIKNDIIYSINILSNNMIDSFKVTPSKEFIKFVEKFFKERDVNIKWNSSYDKFWEI